MEVKIRKAKLTDAKRIADLSLQLGYQIGVKSVKKNLQKILNDERHIIYVAELIEHDTKNVIGYFHGFITTVPYYNEVIEGCALVVDKSKRNFGTAKKLMFNAEAWAKANGVNSFVFHSNVVRDTARVFYKRIGYTILKKQFLYFKDLSKSEIRNYASE